MTQGKLGVFNTPVTGTNTDLDINVKGWGEAGDQVRCYLSYAESGEDVSARGFGSFIIKTRAEKTGRNISKNTAITSNGGSVGNVQLHTNGADR